MYYQPKGIARNLAVAGALTAWFGLGLQLKLMMEITDVPKGFLLANYFSYFTILTNLIVAITFTLLSLQQKTLLTRTSMLPGTALYIVVVGVVYNLVLRHPTEGWHTVANEIVHSIVPIIFPIYWLVFVPKGGLKWKYSIYWVCYILLYGAYSIIRGEIVNWYPYPFVNVQKIGYGSALLNFFWIFLFFLIMAILLIAVCRKVTHNKSATL